MLLDPSGEHLALLDWSGTDAQLLDLDLVGWGNVQGYYISGWTPNGDVVLIRSSP